MKISLFILLIILGCSSKENPKKPLGANAQQAAVQEARDDMANPAVPATNIPPAGTPVVIPPVQP